MTTRAGDLTHCFLAHFNHYSPTFSSGNKIASLHTYNTKGSWGIFDREAITTKLTFAIRELASCLFSKLRLLPIFRFQSIVVIYIISTQFDKNCDFSAPHRTLESH